MRRETKHALAKNRALFRSIKAEIDANPRVHLIYYGFTDSTSNPAMASSDPRRNIDGAERAKE